MRIRIASSFPGQWILNAGVLVSSLAVLALAGQHAAIAQAITGDIVGTVIDSTGAVIPNATVIVTNAGTQERRQGQKWRRGRLRLFAAPTGLIPWLRTPRASRHTSCLPLRQVPATASDSTWRSNSAPRRKRWRCAATAFRLYRRIAPPSRTSFRRPLSRICRSMGATLLAWCRSSPV